MARASPFLSLCFALLAITSVTTAHPFRHQRVERRSVHRQTEHGIHRISDTTIDVPHVKESLHGRYRSTFSLAIAALERLRIDTLSSIQARHQPNESSDYVVDLPFTVEQLQEKLESFTQSLLDDLERLRERF